MTLVFLLEEASMKTVLDIILPKILPESVFFRTIAHSGKSDLQAVSKAYGADVNQLSKKSKYRNPDAMGNPKEELLKLFPRHQQIDGARKIAVHMDIENNTSDSFNCFVSGVRSFAQG